MSKTIKRKIIVDGSEYIWVMDGDGIDSKETHIRVHKNKNNRTILYIDPYSWELEIRPKVIAKAIKFANSIGWGSEGKKEKIYISIVDGSFVELPKGISFGYQRQV